VPPAGGGCFAPANYKLGTLLIAEPCPYRVNQYRSTSERTIRKSGAAIIILIILTAKYPLNTKAEIRAAKKINIEKNQ